MTPTERELRALLSQVHAAWLPRDPATAEIRKRIAKALQSNPTRETQ
jgi:hypothetical protein